MNVPVELVAVKATLPDADAPVTVAVQSVNLPTFIDDGVHESVNAVAVLGGDQRLVEDILMSE